MAVRIFLVEDEASIRDALKLNLELEGYEVVTTGDGKQVLKLFKEQHFDIILLDIMLPEVSGLELCEQIRLVNIDIPIIFLTAKDTTADKVAGLKKVPTTTLSNLLTWKNCCCGFKFCSNVVKQEQVPL